VKNKITVWGICGGNGVILYPFRKYLVGNLEPRGVFKTPGDIQWKLNFEAPLYHDFQIALGSVPRGEEPTLVIGAPDCGHSSILGLSRKKAYSDPRNNESLATFIESTQSLNPLAFVMENLSKVLESIPKQDFRDLFPDYSLIFHEGSVMDFGNSQANRKRLLIVGAKNSPKIDKAPFKKVYQIRNPQFCDELLKGLVYGRDCHIREDISTLITLYAGFKTSAEEIQKGWVQNNWARWPVSGRNFSTAPGVYRNLGNQYPNTARKANRQYNSDGLMMSPRELARIMGIPDSFQLWQDDTRMGYCINKGRLTATKGAVYEVGKWVKLALFEAIR